VVLGGVDGRSVLDDLALQLDEGGDAAETGVGLGDPGELGRLVLGQVLGVLPQGVAGPLDRARLSAATPGRPVSGSMRRRPEAAFQASRRTTSNASVAQATMWKGSAQRTACGPRWATTMAIHSAASAETWVTWAQRTRPEQVEEPFQGCLVAACHRPDEASAVVVDHDGRIC